MRLALRLAQRGYGSTSPNPMVGAIIVRDEKVLGQGWHRRAGFPHAEVEAIRDAQANERNIKGATLFVTLEPCSTFGRTPPCTDAIVKAGIRRVVVAATDPNPAHAGEGFRILRENGIEVEQGLLASEANQLNEAFNHWIVHRNPFVTVKSAMSIDGKIATATGDSKWITSERARAWAMKVRRGSDAILVGARTVIADDPSLTLRGGRPKIPPLRRIILDATAVVPLDARVVSDEFTSLTTVVVTPDAPRARVQALAKRVQVWTAPKAEGRVDGRWVLSKLGDENVTSLLVEGGGEMNASFLLGGMAHRIMFFYAPCIVGGVNSRKAVAGEGVLRVPDALTLRHVEWRRIGPDLLLTGRIA
jgi:diaminohydroxyphosphoribosylaminopyrimidine deaminase / 5-amino-6-(5-phosphoribosylamino)uracil reductase